MWTLHQGDCLDVLRTMESESVNCCVTSPPYWGLRDYGVEPIKWPAMQYKPMAGLPDMDIPEMDCCLGLEPTPEAFIGHIVLIFREVNRVLRKDGTLWLNLGDTYSANRGYQVPQTKDSGSKRDNDAFNNMSMKSSNIGLNPKNLIGIPWRVAFALQADGWYLRSDIIWSKPNPMPESVTDRPTKSHEYIFLFSKSSRYYYNADAIKEPAKESSLQRLRQDIEHQPGSQRANGGNKTNGPMKAVCFGGNKADGYGSRKYSGNEWSPTIAACTYGIHDRKHQNAEGIPYITVNKRTVWNIATKPFTEAHFATFPPEIPETCIKAGCPEGGTALDPFAGAGTTLFVAEQLGRNSIGIEIKSEYCDMTRRRMATIEPSLFEKGAGL